MKNETIINQVNDFYTARIEKYGANPDGVAWRDLKTQYWRFDKLMQVFDTRIEKHPNFTLCDYGCGYGALYDYLQQAASLYPDFHYTGFDISSAMLAAAREKLGHNDKVHLTNQLSTGQQFDYVVASGIFNICEQMDKEAWLQYILKTLTEFNALAREGFAFNICSLYSDKAYRKDIVYYADPCYFFDYCKTHFSRNVSLLHDYDLYEFTVIVRKRTVHY